MIRADLSLGGEILEFGILLRSSFSNRPSFAYSQPTCDVVKVMSLSGLALLSFALFKRSIVPPVINSTGVPVVRELLRNRLRDQIPPASAPDTDDEFFLRRGRIGKHHHGEDQQKSFHFHSPLLKASRFVPACRNHAGRSRGNTSIARIDC